MTAQEIIGSSIFIGIAFLFSIALVIGFGLMLHVGQGIRREPMPWIFLLFAAVIVAGPVSSGRNLAGLSIFFEADVETFVASLWINRVVNVLVLVFAAECFSRRLFSVAREPIAGWALFAAFVVFVVTNSVVNGIWGTVPSLSHLVFYTLAGTLTITLIAHKEISRIVWFAKLAVTGILLLSAVFAIVNPAVVIQKGYSGGFLPFRYWGLGAHANTLSPLIVCLFFCLWYQPFQRGWLNLSVWLLAIVSLLLTQSKTAIASAALVFGILLFYRYRAALSLANAAALRRGLLWAILGVGVFGILGILVIQLVFDFGKVFDALFSTRVGAQVATVSSRDQIWYFALREWRANIWFGYGPQIFEGAYRMMIGISQAYHAHNQFMQSLSSGGIVGAFGLLVLVTVMGFYAWRARISSSGISLAMFGFIVLRGIAEVPLALRGVANSEYFFFIVFYAICLAHQPARKKAAAIAADEVVVPRLRANLAAKGA